MPETEVTTQPACKRRSAIACLLWPKFERNDPAFRSEVVRLSVRAIYVLAGVNVLMPLLGMLFHMAASIAEPVAPGDHSKLQLLLIPLGLLLLAVARIPYARQHARLICFVSGFASAALLSYCDFAQVGDLPGQLDDSLVSLVVVLMVAVAAIPAMPVQILAFGILLNGSHFLTSSWAASAGWIQMTPSMHDYAGMDLLTILATALCAVNYSRLYATHRAHQDDLASRSRLLVTENAATLGRFAATMSHELNNPLGALRSSMDSLERLQQRRRERGNSERLDALEADLYSAAGSSLDHMQGVVRRMQRLTNLDRAEIAAVDIEQLLQDVTAAVGPECGGVAIELETGELPPLRVRPQRITSVFSRLLHNAVSAPGVGHVDVAAHRHNGSVEVAFRDDRSDRLPEDTAELFQPGFRVDGQRVSGSEWGLFSAREAVREHGGDIEAKSNGRGVEFVVRLPVAGAAA